MKIGIIGAGWWGKNLVRFFYELGVLKTVCDIDERTLNDIKVKYDEVKTTKNLGSFGDGGMISTNDEEINDIIRCLIKHGGKDKYNVEHIGYNARLDTIQAAILLAKLKYVEEFNKKRREIANIYNENFKDIEEIETPADLEEAYNVYHQYTIKIRHCKRDEIKKIFRTTENKFNDLLSYFFA